MQITLYENCILSSSYSEVFDNKIEYAIEENQEITKTAFEHYLDTLEKFDTEQETVYMKNNGIIYIELQSENNWNGVYAYNYMKCVSGNLIRYCFIDNIEIMNGIAEISYSTDIWHTYSKNINIRNSYLSYALRNKYNGMKDIKIRELPTEYTSNEPIEYAKLTNENKYCIIAQMQRYNIVTGGEVGQRYNAVGLFYKEIVNNETNETTRSDIFFDFDEAIYSLQQIAQGQSTEFSGNFYYEFDNWTIVPYSYLTKNNEFAITLNYSKFDSFNRIIKAELPTYTQARIAVFEDNSSELINTLNISLPFTDYKTISIGTFKSDYGYVNNGTDSTINVFINATDLDFKLLINFNGKLIDITPDFVIDVPYSSINGETQAQRKIARESATVNGAMNIIGGINQIATNIATFGTSRSIENLSKKYRYGKNNRLTSTKLSREIESYGGGDVSGIVGGGLKIAHGITDIIFANKPQYQTQYGAFVLGNNQINCKYGLIKKKIKPDNENEVNRIIANTGYRVYEIVNTEIFEPILQNEENYNVLKFETVNAYGNAPQSVIEIYKNILFNGVKIWYNHTNLN